MERIGPLSYQKHATFETPLKNILYETLSFEDDDDDSKTPTQRFFPG